MKILNPGRQAMTTTPLNSMLCTPRESRTQAHCACRTGHHALLETPGKTAHQHNVFVQVFERVASDVVMGALDGVNGTVFAYGQTSSGKTYTITGGAARYAERGIIPRAISLIYAELLRRSDYTYSVGNLPRATIP